MSTNCPAWKSLKSWWRNHSRATCFLRKRKLLPWKPLPANLTSSSQFMPVERLQKIISAAGIASRRKAEPYITGGLVSVNGKIITELGSKADLEHDHIRVNGKLLREVERHVYLLMNKPKNYVTTLSDPQKRPTVMQLLQGVGARVYPIGRLDYASEGLLLLTKDGELANQMMKAASHVQKTYMVQVAGTPSPEGLGKLRTGLSIRSDKGKRVRTAPAKINVIRERNNP